MTIGLIEQGKLDGFEIEKLISPLEGVFSTKVIVDKINQVPGFAFNSQRQQYHSTGLLNSFADKLNNFKRVLGVVDVDLYVPCLNFVFGEADLAKKIAIISITRLKPQFYGLPLDNQRLTERVIREAIHELGHTFKLGHCANPICVMRFSNTLSEVDHKSSSFCFNCKRLVLGL